jgi:hypothetical protein
MYQQQERNQMHAMKADVARQCRGWSGTESTAREVRA